MSSSPPSPAAAAVAAPNALRRFLDGDVWHSFRRSPTAIVAALIAFVCVFCAVFAEFVAPHNPFDLASLELMDARLPPAWEAEGSTKYLLGTDDQGRDILSALMYGARISLFVGLASVLLSMLIGVGLGLLAGFVGGKVDAFIMRVCDVMLSFPSILIALLIDGVGRAMFPNAHDTQNLATLELADSRLPPSWMPDGKSTYLLGTDDQGRDILSALMYGARISLFVGLASVLLSVVVGVSLGLLAGFVGGKADAFIMRFCDVMLSFPAILVALLIDGVGRAMFPNAHDTLAFAVLVLAIALPGWVQYARTVRGST
ncbi:MAG TPA: hypothetical protein VJN44_18060, partial [Roseateles sp.]|nr:hypothetical protein [Roseateles sp.]